MLLKKALLISLSLMFAAQVAAKENVILVLDASGSMWGQINGKSKVEIAREAVSEVLANLSADDQLGLVAYGHRRKGDCNDIETLLPLAAVNAQAFTAKVNSTKALGMTPLSAAVKRAAQELKFSEQKATVILLSDGEETCDLDPCQVGAELEATGVDFTAHVIGFDISNPQHQEQLECLARNTGGKYFNASNAGELRAAMKGATAEVTAKKLPPANASLKISGDVVAATNVTVAWEGPADQQDYIAFVKPDAPPLSYTKYADNLKKGVAAQLQSPSEAGDYELRYISPNREKPVLTSIKVKVLEAKASVEGPSQVIASDIVSVKAKGPKGGDGTWIGFAPKGSAPTAYISYDEPDDSGTSALRLNTPQKPGEYELRFVLANETVIASQAVTVLPAKPRFINAAARYRAGEEITITIEGPISTRNWVGLVSRGGTPSDYKAYDYVNAQREMRFHTPSEAGDYDLVFVMGGEVGEEIVLRQAVTIAQ